MSEWEQANEAGIPVLRGCLRERVEVRGVLHWLHVGLDTRLGARSRRIYSADVGATWHPSAEEALQAALR